MHPLLARQLRKLGLSEDAPPDREQWRALLQRVGRTYAEADQDRYTLERSMMLSSREMREMYDALRPETRRLEEQLRQAQKMEAIGQLAGGISHDFNNILCVVLSYADIAARTLGSRHDVTPYLVEIGRAAERAAALTRQLLTFSRQSTSQPKVLRVDVIVDGMQRMLSRLIGEDITLESKLEAQDGAVQADPSQLEQVVMNLVVNARDAMPAGGRLSIETAVVDLGDAEAAAMGLGAGSYVRLSVVDTGCGMDPATRAHIFEPFFTTKEVGKGTGLGLSTVFGIVQSCGGGIAVDSEPGRGTAVRILLPRVGGKAGSLRPPRLTTDFPEERGSGTVLLVEDDDQVRRGVETALADGGYRVLAARSGREGLELLGERGDDVELLLTDLVMPGMDGRSVATEALKSHPHVKVLYMSGYAEHRALKQSAAGPPGPMLRKPFTAGEMMVAVREALGRVA
jgi:signal transduction histidine kinase